MTAAASPLSLYSFFHLNLAFSSIEEELRPEVVRRCYWPLLRLARDQELPFGIEASGYTLEVIEGIDPAWTAELRRLCQNGVTEFIGSGYSQMIGPLVPARVNAANQRLGLETYEKILGFRPRLALVNEQAYSAGMVGHYRKAGYQGVIMEWDNPGSAHPEWDPDWRYLPQLACGADGSVIPVIWNKSIPFQKFQRYAHGEMELTEYLEYLTDRAGKGERAFALYGNDAEIFDFRPGRFHTEAVLHGESEWGRIAALYEALVQDSRFRLIAPGAVLDLLSRPGAGNRLRLESPAHPVPVKKQAKYNVLRWAVTGRDDLGINTDCWRIYEALVRDGREEPGAWKDLCYLWSSDFRTHITPGRWEKYRERLSAALDRHVKGPIEAEPPAKEPVLASAPFRVHEEGGFLEIETGRQKVRLNCRRGLAIDGVWWGGQLLLGTLPHGYFDDISFGADFYSGHVVFERPGQHKVTDLAPVRPQFASEGECLIVAAEIPTALGPLRKKIRIHPREAELELAYHFLWPESPIGSLRLGHVTLHPQVFERNSLFFSTHNGGSDPESFLLSTREVHHLAPVSPLVSASQGLGLTEGIVEIGDRHRRIAIETERTLAAVTGHVQFAPVDDRFFLRLAFSAAESDDTCCAVSNRGTLADRRVCFRLRLLPYA